MEKMIDMHTHTIYSDGENTPDELITLAKNNDVEAIAITDHNTVNAYKHITVDANIKIIPGIEFTAKDDRGKMHILGYGIDPYDKALNEVIKDLKENDIEFLLLIVDRLKKHKIDIYDKDISSLLNREGSVGRGTVARLMVKYGYASSVNEAFDLYLEDIYKEIKHFRKFLSYEECFQVIINAGGIPVLAHPCTLNRDMNELERLILKMVASGLKGVEVYHSNQSIGYMDMLKRLVDKYNLLYSVGSDYHGSVAKPDIKIGTGKHKNLCLTKCSVLDYLDNR